MNKFAPALKAHNSNYLANNAEVLNWLLKIDLADK
jgi:hypothetical protein